MKSFMFKLAFMMLLTVTVICGVAFHYTFQKYCEYRGLVGESGSRLPRPYYAWDGGLWVTIALEALLLIWIPFIYYSTRERIYPYLRQRLTYQEMRRVYGSMARLLHDKLYGSVLYYFKNANRKARSRLAVWYMKLETLEHVDLLIRVFKWVVLPASFFYVCTDFYFFEQNALDSMLLGILVFFYSSFLPDLLSMFRRKVYRDVRDTLSKDIPWYKKYALLLFAPVFILAFFYGTRLRWKTTETFHNFKSLTIFGAFLFVLSFLAFGNFPISIGDVTEILSVPSYGLIGYLTHLKVDLCF